MYESPIQEVFGGMRSELMQEHENQILVSVKQTIGYDIDKEELIKALNYDRQQYEKGYEDGLKAGEEQANAIIDEQKTQWIEQGRNEAWEAAGKILLRTIDGGMREDDIRECFGEYLGFVRLFKGLTASEVIEKIREYEQKQQKDELHVGDEVVYYNNPKNKLVIVHIKKVDDNTEVRVIDAKGHEYYTYFSKLKKTGRTFPEIAQVLEKMKEEENGKS